MGPALIIGLILEHELRLDPKEHRLLKNGRGLVAQQCKYT